MTTSTRHQRARLRREQILDAALLLFAEKGLAETTIKDLAEATQTAQGLIYHYFQSKEELLLQVVEQRSFLPALRQLLTPLPEQPADEVLLMLTHHFSTLLTENTSLVRVFFRESQVNPVVARHLNGMIHEAVSLLAAYITARIDIGELRIHDAAVTARGIFYTTVMLHLTHTPSHPFLTTFIENVLQGIRKPE